MNISRRNIAICILVLGLLISGCGPGQSVGPTRFVAIAAGGYHTCALTSGGGVKCWGDNGYGQLGDGTKIQRLTPVDVIGLTSGVSAIAAGAEHTCALTSNGGVKCWGSNEYGQLGDGTNTTTESYDKTMPVDVIGLTSGVSSIAAGEDHTCALTSIGGVKCWGGIEYDQFGKGTPPQHLTLAVVIGLASGIRAIAAGAGHTCALTSGGGVKCWGSANSFLLGVGSYTNQGTPAGVLGLSSGVTAIAAGANHTCALTSSGSVECWGNNDAGDLGDGTSFNEVTPVDVIGLTSGIIAISAGDYHTCALTSNGGVKCWGYNKFGQLGDGTTTSRLTPVDVIGLSSPVSAIAVGTAHTCALTSNGGVKCWGYNEFGQLGDGTTTYRVAPVDVIGLSSRVSGIAAGGFYTCSR